LLFRKGKFMRILMLCDALGIGGAETHIVTLIKGLLKSQNEVTLICGGGIYEEKIRNAGAKLIYAPLDKRDVFSIIKSLRIIKKNLREYDVIHAHTRLSAYLASLARGGYSLPKIVVSAHLNFSEKGIGRFTEWGDITLAVSEDIKQHLIKAYGVKENRIILTKNGIDLGEYRGKLRDEKRIVHISRIDSDRSLAAFLLCKIAPRLLTRFCDYTIDIYGDGSMAEELKSAANDANDALGRRGVVLHGATANVADALSVGGIFVGVSRAALEAMAMRLPTVIAGNEGYGGILCKGNIALLEKSNLCARGLEETKEEKLMRDITALIDNQELYLRCSKFGYEAVLRHYSSDSMVTDAKNAYLLANSDLRISVLGYFGFGNLGDEKTLSLLLEILWRKGAEITGIISKASKDRKQKSFFSVIKNSDALVLGGGNLLQNETSLRSLLYYTAIMLIASAMKKRVIPIASGVGEIKGRFASFAARLAVSRCYEIGARTHCDKNEFYRLGAKSVRLMPDLCFTIEEKCHEQNSTAFLVIFKDGKAINEDVIKAAASESGLAPIAIVISREDNKDSVKSICSSLGIKLQSVESYTELQTIISGCRFTLTEKLHGAIFSLVNHKECFVDTNTKKVFALYKEITERCTSLGVQNPLTPISELPQKNIKEAGASISDFNKLLNSLREDIESSLDAMI